MSSSLLDREDTSRSHKRLHRSLPPLHSSSLQHLMYPPLPEYTPMNNNLNSPPAAAPSSPPAPHSSSSLEKYSSILIGELKKKPQKEKALKDALELQDRINQLETQLQSTESESQRRKKQMEDQLDELDRKKEETRKHIDMLASDMEHARENTRISIKSLQSHPDFRDRHGIDAISREIDHLNQHANRVRTIAKLSDYGTCGGGDASDGVNGEGGGGGGGGGGDPSLLCTACLSIPTEEQIFACNSCENMICGSCRPHVNSCPTCRKNFKSNPPKRNRLAERLMACRK